MSLSGPQVLSALDAALADIRREEDDIVRKLARSAERTAKIRDAEAEQLRRLAKARLTRDRGEELSGQLVAAGIAARAAFKARGAEMAAAAARVTAIEAEQAALATEREAALGEIDRHQAMLRTLAPRIASAIARDPEYARAQQASTDLKAIAAASQAKARQADVEREARSRAYRGDPLFLYLVQRRYGAPDYRAGMFARLDAWIARLVDFDRAQRNFATLTAWPSALHAHAEQQVAVAAAADEAIDALEHAAIDAAGGAEAREALALAQEKLAAIDSRTLPLQDERSALITRQTQLLEGDDTAFLNAMIALTQAMGSADISAFVLAERVARPGAADASVLQLGDTHQRAVDERLGILDLQGRLETLATRRHELEDIAYEFKARKFDDPRSLFRDDGLAAGALNDFLTGETKAHAYWQALRQSQGWSVGTSDWGGGIGLPRRGRRPGDAPQAAETPSFSRPRETATEAN